MTTALEFDSGVTGATVHDVSRTKKIRRKKYGRSERCWS